MKFKIFKKPTKALVHFKHWTRKKYGVFASLSKTVKICTLCLAYGMLVMPVKSKSQNQADTSYLQNEYALDEVVITGNLSPGVYSEVSRIVTVISKDEIGRAPVQSIPDLLDYALNVDI